MALVLLLAVGGVQARQHKHGADTESAKPVLNHGKKWHTDQPLRVGMSKIAALMEPLQAMPADASLDPAVAKAIAEGIKEQVAFLISHCKLEPKADAVLHPLLAALLTGADALSGAAPSNRDAEPIRAALAKYPTLFFHPGWQAPKARE